MRDDVPVRPRPSIFHGVFTTLCVLALAGCDRNVEPYQPGEEARPPDLARIFPAPVGQMAPPEGEARPAANAAGGTPRGAVPPSRAEGTRGNLASASGPIRGEIDLDPDLAMARPDGGVLFVIARPQGMTAGPPLAVLRIPSPEFPLDFSIGPENVMIPTMQFAGEISLSARLDADGNAMTRGAGDISSPVVEGLTPGSQDVRLVLAERG